ncbi:MAG: hypothetical protein WCW17_00315 [Patescibacteria group bacterium]
MPEVEIDKIMPVSELKNNTEKIITDVQNSAHPENLYVFLDNESQPAAALININYLKKITGKERIPVKKPMNIESAKPQTTNTTPSTSENNTPSNPINNNSSQTSYAPKTPEIKSTETFAAPPTQQQPSDATNTLQTDIKETTPQLSEQPVAKPAPAPSIEPAPLSPFSPAESIIPASSTSTIPSTNSNPTADLDIPL